MGGRRGWGAAAIALISLGIGSGAHAQVALRGGGKIEGEVVAVGPEGVSVRAGGAIRVVSWARARGVEGDLQEAAKAFASLADGAWRALARLDRGDITLAEPALEALHARGVGGATGADIALGLLACRLARGANVSVVPVWLEWTRLATDGAIGEPERDETSGADAAARGRALRVVDAETLLVPGLAPIFAESAALRAFATGAAAADEGDLGALYRFAAARQCGLDAPVESDGLLARRVGDSAGAALVRSIVAAQFGDAAERAAARSELQAGIDREPGGWKEAWRRAALGRSLVREGDAASLRKGALELLHVPARFADVQRTLAALALAEAADATEANGDTATAEALRAELRVEFPGVAAGTHAAGGGAS